MAEIAGPNPAEPIVLFTTGHARSVCWGFVGYEEHGQKETQRINLPPP